MNDNLDGEFFEFRRARRNTNAKMRAPRATRSTVHKKKKGNVNAGGVHQRRNKHWSW